MDWFKVTVALSVVSGIDLFFPVLFLAHAAELAVRLLLAHDHNYGHESEMTPFGSACCVLGSGGPILCTNRVVVG
jgi:hypothetical protein